MQALSNTINLFSWLNLIDVQMGKWERCLRELAYYLRDRALRICTYSNLHTGILNQKHVQKDSYS
jgi:hypothetical protein